MNIHARCFFKVIACLLLAVVFTHSYTALALSGGSLSPPARFFDCPPAFGIFDDLPPALKNSFAALKAAKFLFSDFALQTQEGLSLTKLNLGLSEQSPALIYAALAGAVALLLSLMAAVFLLMPRRKALRRLELAEQRYRAMFENAVEGIFHLAPGSVLTAANASLAKILGYADAQAMLGAGVRVRDVLIDPDVEDELLSRLKASGVVPGTDVSVRRSDGQEIILWVTLRAVRDTAGNIEFIEGRAMDVTDDRRIRAELETNRERLRLALETSSDGIWDYDVLSGQCYYSPRYFTMLGYEPDAAEQPRETWSRLLHPADRAAAMFKMAQFESGAMGKDAFEAIYRMKSADGGYKWILSRSQAVRRAPSGMALRIIGINMDITELKKVQEELGELNRDLERRVELRTQELSEANTALAESLAALGRMHDNLVQSEKMAALGGLVAGVAHEINTPVGLGVTSASWLMERTEAVVGRLGKGELKRSELDKYLETAEESCATILANLKRAADLVQSFKQVAVDQAAGDAREFNLSDLVNEVLLSLQPKYKRTGHKVETDIPADITMYSYPGDIMQIITNLVMNSLLHAFEGMSGGVISIFAQKKPRKRWKSISATTAAEWLPIR